MPSLAFISIKQNIFRNLANKLNSIFKGDDFQDLQDNFMEKYYNEFEDTEENKLIYMDIFKEYVSSLTFLYHIKSGYLTEILWIVNCLPLERNNAPFTWWNHIFSSVIIFYPYFTLYLVCYYLASILQIFLLYLSSTGLYVCSYIYRQPLLYIWILKSYSRYDVIQFTYFHSSFVSYAISFP